MKVFKKLLIIMFVVICPNFLLSEIFNRSDLNFLNIKDKKVFLEKCLEKENFINIPRCLNFLGLKILLNNLNNLEISRESLKYIENQSIFYLKEAAERGSIEAYINLGWVYSSDNFELQDLKKSAEYFKLYHTIKIKNSQISSLQKEKKSKMIIDRDQIILGTFIMQKLDLYKKHNIDQENYYLTEIEYKKGKKVFEEIINISNLSVLEIELLKQEILKKNKIKFNKLENDLNSFKKKYRRIAIKELNKLQEILKKLY